MPKPTIFYVYVLRDPREGKNLQPIYVGKGQGYRSRQHWSLGDNHKNRLLGRVLGKIRKEELKPIIEFVLHCEVEADAFRLEIELIAKYGRRDLRTGSLCNLTSGGEGFTGRSPETREKIAAAMRARERNPDSIAKMAATKREQGFPQDVLEKAIAANKIREYSKEQIEKTAASHRGRKRPLETCEKIRAKAIGRKPSLKTRAKMRKAKIGYGPTPEIRAMGHAARRGQKASPETRAKMREAHRNRVPRTGWNHSPEAIEKMREAALRRAEAKKSSTNQTALSKTATADQVTNAYPYFEQ
jgi:hypothetical protein